MRLTLEDIPGLTSANPVVWKVKALAVDDRNPVLASLVDWKRHHPEAFKAIYKVMRLASQQTRVSNPKHVKKNENPKHGEVYEMLAYGDIARVMFFYDRRNEYLIVCTNTFEKGKGDQDAAFARCAELRRLYLESTTPPAFRHD